MSALPRHLRSANATLVILRAIAAGLALIGASVPVTAQDRTGRNSLSALREAYAEEQARFEREMTELAGFCRANGFSADAQEIEELARPAAEQTHDLDALPEQKLPDLSLNLSPVEREWQAKLRKYRTDHADELYQLGQRSIRAGYPSVGFQLLREVAFHNPDHRMARQALGFVQYEDGWTTPFRRERLRRGFVWNDRFGWLPRTHEAKYENGQRYYEGRWISAEKEASLRADLRNAWTVLTEHFEIHTNHSLERGVELGEALEQFHQFFVREFAGFFNTPQQMAKLFDSGTSDVRGAANRYVIHYYRTRDEFIQRLQPKQPNIAVSNGLYLPSDRIAYFYHDPADPDANLSTMFHEVTHQLLGESARTIHDVGSAANFWLIEGLACYMESFRHDSTGPHVGDPTHVRIHWARVRVLDEAFYIPMARFTSLGQRQFQMAGDTPTLQRYYSQASGMAHFFMHYHDGVYRDALIQHLSQIYSPDARVRRQVAGLDQLTQVPFEELDRQYRDYLATLPALDDAVPQSAGATRQ